MFVSPTFAKLLLAEVVVSQALLKGVIFPLMFELKWKELVILASLQYRYPKILLVSLLMLPRYEPLILLSVFYSSNDAQQ
jgi:hypothetical protein